MACLLSQNLPGPQPFRAAQPRWKNVILSEAERSRRTKDPPLFSFPFQSAHETLLPKKCSRSLLKGKIMLILFGKFRCLPSR